MQHADPDQLALLALGESLDGDDAEVTAHLQLCVVCRHEVDALRRTAELAREAVEYRDDEELDAPPEVWERISADLDLGGPALADLGGSAGSASGGSTGGPSGGSTGGTASGWAGGGSGGSVGVDAVSGPDGPVHAGEHRRGDRGGGADGPAAGAAVGDLGAARVRRRWVRTAGALVAAVAVGVVGTLVAVRPFQDDGPAAPAVASSTAQLGPVTGGPGGASGRAAVRQGAAGPELDVTAVGLPLQQGYYEVWVFDGDRNMVSVGVLGADSTAALPLPPTLDLRTYHDVDISQERYDGDQTHSRTSVLRGTLTG